MIHNYASRPARFSPNFAAYTYPNFNKSHETMTGVQSLAVGRKIHNTSLFFVLTQQYGWEWVAYVFYFVHEYTLIFVIRFCKVYFHYPNIDLANRLYISSNYKNWLQKYKWFEWKVLMNMWFNQHGENYKVVGPKNRLNAIFLPLTDA